MLLAELAARTVCGEKTVARCLAASALSGSDGHNETAASVCVTLGPSALANGHVNHLSLSKPKRPAFGSASRLDPLSQRKNVVVGKSKNQASQRSPNRVSVDVGDALVQRTS